jgi:hypothetical protein
VERADAAVAEGDRDGERDAVDPTSLKRQVISVVEDKR